MFIASFVFVMIKAAPVENNDNEDGSLKMMEEDELLKPTDTTVDVEDSKKGGGARPVYRPPVRPPVSNIRPGGNAASSNSLQTCLFIVTFLIFFAVM